MNTAENSHHINEDYAHDDGLHNFIEERLAKCYDPEPFCPFLFSGYCNDAYSLKCYSCWAPKDEYYNLTER